MANSTDTSTSHTYVFYHYDPSMGAAVLFVILFFATTHLHVFQTIRRKTWYLIPFIVGGYFEWIGYIGRGMSSKDPQDMSPYIMQTILLLIAPALFAASIYMILGRIILLVNGEKYSLIRKKLLTKVFVCGDVVSFLLQAGGGGMMAGGDADKVTLGKNVVIIGLFVQISFFGFFIVVSIVFHRRVNYHMPSLAVPWIKHMRALYAVSGLIMVRSLFRVIEYLMGNDGVLMQHEIFVYLFDGLLMFIAMVLFNVVHPAEITELRECGRELIMEESALV
ncbi:MAG: hypothetical protein M1834_008850 [Cirrosporium novae-zelandiae]|nr:MAG: hypothetical protein M1834_008850 [Cirrosporium novae-zelandiae]